MGRRTGRCARSRSSGPSAGSVLAAEIRDSAPLPRRPPMSRVDLTKLPIVATEFGRWQPLNGPLGVNAFGINAIVCDPGETFDIRHDEADSGHQEAYVVVSGRAR